MQKATEILFSSLIQNDRKAYIWKKNYSSGLSAPHCTFLPPPKLSSSGYHQGRNDEKENGLRSEPKLVHMKPGEHSWAAACHIKLIKTFWLTCGPGHVITPLCVWSPLPALQKPNPALSPWYFGWALVVQLFYWGTLLRSAGGWPWRCQTKQIFIQLLTGLSQWAWLLFTQPSLSLAFCFLVATLKYRFIFWQCFKICSVMNGNGQWLKAQKVQKQSSSPR